MSTPSPPTIRSIAALALPALVLLAAEPLYLLIDTAVVGRLGREALAALAIGGGLLTVVAWLATIIAYGTTGRSARQYGAGDRGAAVAEGVQASWLGLIIGVLIALVAQLAADPVAAALAGGKPEIAGAAAQWLRIAALGAPGLILAAAGNGWMRGVHDAHRPMWFVVAAFALSAVLCPIFVYPLGWGLPGSAWANVIAQTLAGALFVRALIAERVDLRPRPRIMLQQLRVGRDLLIRGLALQACFLSAAAVAARFGAATLAAHHIALQLWMFSVLALDSVAIAAQSLIGAQLGASDSTAARRLAGQLAVIGGLAGVVFAILIGVSAEVLPAWFGADEQVRAQAAIAWPWFAGMQPLAGVVFALDGVLIGAGDVRYMRNLTITAAVAGFLPAIWSAYLFDLGIGGIWAGLTLFIVIRLVALLARLRSGRWAVEGREVR